MPRRHRQLLVFLGVGLILLLVFTVLFWLGAFDAQVARLAFMRDRDSYQLAAERVIREKSAGTKDRVFANSRVPDELERLTEGMPFIYFRVDGHEFVYFDLNDDVTMSSGLIYTASGEAPPDPPAYGLQKIDSHWYSVSFQNAFLESGRLDR